MFKVSIRPASVVAALFLMACGGGAAPPGDGGTTADASSREEASTPHSGGGCATGMPRGGECNAVSNDGCASDETCVVYRDDDNRAVTGCMPAGSAPPGGACGSLNDCGPGFGCYGGVCAKLCCGDGDDATCQTGVGANPNARCLETIEGVALRVCYVSDTVDTGSSCDDDLVECNGYCVDAQRDAQNCGACGHSCGSGEACFDGICCPDLVGETTCGGACVNTRIDRDNCGRCGHACGAKEICRHDGFDPGGGECTAAGAPCGSDNDCGDVAGVQLRCRPASLGYPGGQCGGEEWLDCDYGIDCREGYYCQGGLCRPQCSTNPALLCGQNVCHSDENLCGAPGTDGYATGTGGCWADSDCSPGSTCSGPELTNLSRTCECTAQTDCGPGRGCFANQGGVHTCGCASDAICGPGHHCGADHQCDFVALQ